MEEVGNLVLASQVFERLGNYDGGGGLDLKGFWWHSVGAAIIARAVAKKLQKEVEAAFLYDLVKVVLNRYFSDYYGAAFERIGQGDRSLNILTEVAKTDIDDADSFLGAQN